MDYEKAWNKLKDLIELRERGYSTNVDDLSEDIHNLRIGHRDELRFLQRCMKMDEFRAVALHIEREADTN